MSAKSGQGIEDLAAGMLGRVRETKTSEMATKEAYFFAKWVRDAWGKTGAAFLEEDRGGARACLDSAGNFEAAQEDFGLGVRAWLNRSGT